MGLHLKHEVQPWKLFALLSHPRSRLYLLPFYSLSSERKQMYFHNAPLLSTTFDEFQRSLAPLQIFEEKTRSQSQDPRHESSHTKRVFRNPNKADLYFSGCNQQDKKTI